MSLSKIQSELKAPKSQTNAFGKYKYRSLEDIMEALKPLLLKYEAHLIVSDEIVLIGDRYYVKALAKITIESNTYEASAYAREDVMKKGMDLSQLTGATSSYARKYALNGLFAIDDTKDADSMDNTHVEPTITNQQVSDLTSAITLHKVDKIKFLAHFKINHLNQLHPDHFGVAMGMINAKKDK